jgi:hypothetical protein
MRKFLLGFVVGILTIPAGAFAAAWLGWLQTNANATPSALEKAFMHLALDRAAVRRAPHLANPIAPTEENLMAGMKLFKGDCAGCHGDANNAAKRETENILYPSPPVFALHPPSKPDYQSVLDYQRRGALFGDVLVGRELGQRCVRERYFG